MSVAALSPAIKNSDASPIGQARRAAYERFAESGWPTRRMESWRFGNLKPLTDTKFAVASADGVSDAELVRHLTELPAKEANLLVFVNGRFSKRHSRIAEVPQGAFVGNFAAWISQNTALVPALLGSESGADHAFANLNTALFTDGPAVVVPDGLRLARPVIIVFWNESARASAAHLRSHIQLGAGASADIIESWGGGGSGWSNIAGNTELGEGASLGLYRLQNEPTTGFHTATRKLRLAGSARYDGFTLVLGAGLSREETSVRLLGPAAALSFNGGYVLSERQEATIVANIVHEAPNCTTNEVFKGVLDGRAHGVFQGRITVEKAAQKTDARQLNKTVLLGDRAIMDGKPELEIFADDVKCAHGASVGDLDETALFYLRSRGLPAEVARRMLVEAFVAEAIELVSYEPAQTFLKQALDKQLVRFGGQVDA